MIYEFYFHHSFEWCLKNKHNSYDIKIDLAQNSSEPSPLAAAMVGYRLREVCNSEPVQRVASKMEKKNYYVIIINPEKWTRFFGPLFLALRKSSAWQKIISTYTASAQLDFSYFSYRTYWGERIELRQNYTVKYQVTDEGYSLMLQETQKAFSKIKTETPKSKLC